MRIEGLSIDSNQCSTETSTTTTSESSNSNEYCKISKNEQQQRNCYEGLPFSIIVKILSYIPMEDRVPASMCCKRWYGLITYPHMWKDCKISYPSKGDNKYLRICKHFAHLFEKVHLNIDQTLEINRISSRYFLSMLAMTRNKRIKTIRIRCTGNNPLFYKSDKYIQVLVNLLSEHQLKGDPAWLSSLETLDLQGLLVAISNEIIDAISKYHFKIKHLNLLDSSLVCLMSRDRLVKLIEKCKELENLAIFRNCISRRALELIAMKDDQTRTALKKLTLMFRHDEKFSEVIDEKIWVDVLRNNPKIEINLIFDNSCQQHRIANHMLKILPVTLLSIHSTIRSAFEIDLANENYSHCLEELELKYDVEWALSPSPVVDKAIRNLVINSENLKVLRVHCGLSKSTIQLIKNNYNNIYTHQRTILYEEEKY